MRANHDVSVRRIGPHGHPPSLTVHLQQCRNPVASESRFKQGHERMQGTEGVPQREVVVTDALVHLVVHRTVVTALLGEFPRKEIGMIDGSIKDCLVLIVSAADLQLLQFAFPGSFCAVTQRLEIPSRQFLLHVGARLLQTDERGAQLHHHLLTVACGKVDISAHAGALLFTLPIVALVVVPDAKTGEGLVETDDEIALEVGQFGA